MVRTAPSIDADALRVKLESLGIPLVNDSDLQSLAWNSLFQSDDGLQIPHPMAIAAPRNEQHVADAVALALHHDLRVGVRSGGHHYGCSWAQSGSLLLNVGALCDVHIDTQSATARFGPGVTGGMLYDALDGTGLHFPGPHLSSVACGGFITGGGNGFGTPLFGAACDCLLSVRMVDARGVRTVTADSEPDLWWAIGGAGGFFGIVVEYCVRLFPVPPALPDALAVVNLQTPPCDDVAAAIQASIHAMTEGNPAIESSTVLCGGGPDLSPCLVLSATSFAPASTSDIEAALDAVHMRAPAAPLLWRREAVPYRTVMRSIDPTYEFPGVCCYGGVLNFTPDALPRAVLASLVTKFLARSSPRSVVLLAHGYPKTPLPCAVGFRGGFIVGVYALWSRTPGGAEADGDARHIAWADDVLDMLRPLSVGQYVNETMFLDHKDAATCYKADDYARLQAVKAEYDPSNTFRSL